jgi:subtilisin family serine protease
MDRRKRTTLGALLVGGTLLGAATPAAAAPFTPREWRGTIRLERAGRGTDRLVSWNRDQDHNFIDDLLDKIEVKPGAAPPRVNVVVDFNRCVTCKPDREDDVITFLRGLGRVGFVSKLLTFAVVSDVPVDQLARIADRDEVAMVESATVFRPMLTVSVAAIRVRASPTFSPNTVEDAFPGITGAGVNIAVIDSGVDDAGGPGTTHAMFPAGTFVGGADCLVLGCSIQDPDDGFGHGTHVAGIALGRPVACPGGTCRGVAPGAGLVDIRIFDAVGGTTADAPFDGLELAIQNRVLWNIGVINMSFGDCTDSNGQNAFALLVNTAAQFGMVPVVAAGNSPNCSLPNNFNLINSVASSSLAITVAAAADGNTVPLNNDTLATFSLTGPRLSDFDGDPSDEQKPEIAAPGNLILSAAFNTATGFLNESGTSMAAPHVAGAAALLLQATPTMNPGSLKQVLIQTAAQSNKPGPHPGWHPFWGNGFLDMYAALSRGLVADVGRPTDPPYAPCGAAWCSPYITTASPPHVNVANTITAQVHNFSANAASNVHVCFGAYVFSNNFNRFFEFGCTFVTIPANTTQAVPFAWTPSTDLIPPGFPAGADVHTCLKVSLDYAFDTLYTNNDMQRNMSVATASLARVPFRLENNTTKPVTIQLVVENNNAKWAVRVMEDGKEVDPVFKMEPGDCPHDLVIELEPAADVPVGDKAQIIVRALADGKDDFGGIVIDGVHEAEPGTLPAKPADPAQPVQPVTPDADPNGSFGGRLLAFLPFLF